MNIKSIKIKFLRNIEVPMQNWVTRCECCGPEMDGYEPAFFQRDEVVDPDELHCRLDLTGLTLGTDYAIVEFVPDLPDCY